jgi:hypothetical protein
MEDQARTTRIARTILRRLGGVITIALGVLLAFPWAALLWTMLGKVVRGRGTFLNSYGMQVWGVTLKGWQIYACAAVMILMGIALMGLGLSLCFRGRTNERGH